MGGHGGGFFLFFFFVLGGFSFAKFAFTKAVAMVLYMYVCTILISYEKKKESE